jgi:hypothetical protein
MFHLILHLTGNKVPSSDAILHSRSPETAGHAGQIKPQSLEVF